MTAACPTTRASGKAADHRGCLAQGSAADYGFAFWGSERKIQRQDEPEAGGRTPENVAGRKTGAELQRRLCSGLHWPGGGRDGPQAGKRPDTAIGKSALSCRRGSQ